MIELSKRELAVRDFVVKIESRMTAALKVYFTSHGVFVRTKDIEQAFHIEEHQGMLRGLSREFEAVNKALQLAKDLGSISLAEKQKAMLALYEIEKVCSNRSGSRSADLAAAHTALSTSVRAWPGSPSFAIAFLSSLAGCLGLFFGHFLIGFVLMATSMMYGAYRLRRYEKTKRSISAQLKDANARFDAAVTKEISARPAIRDTNDNVRSTAWLLVGIVLVLAVASTLYHLGAIDRAVSGSTSSPDVDSASSSATPKLLSGTPGLAEQAQRSIVQFDWMIGKNPYEVLNDRRFKNAFKGISRNEWKKITDLIAVASKITFQNGYYVGSGCKAHMCGSDMAAFAISKATGRGDMTYQETVDFNSNKTAVRNFSWPDIPIASTPLADWARSSGVDVSGASESDTRPEAVFQTSFDCSKANSHTARLICSDAELADNDVKLAEVFAQAKAAASDQGAFKERVRREWNYREQTCHDKDCLMRWYADQLVMLKEIAMTGNVSSD